MQSLTSQWARKVVFPRSIPVEGILESLNPQQELRWYWEQEDNGDTAIGLEELTFQR
jgi:hypothetical protein